MGNVINLNNQVGDKIKVEPDRVLQGAVGNLQTAVVAGVDADGVLYLASSHGRDETIVLLERAKAKLIASWDD